MKEKLNNRQPSIDSVNQSGVEPAARRHFLVPVDFSEASLRALRYAQQLAAGGRACLVLLNVMEEPRSFRRLDLAGQQREQKNKRLAQLQSLAARIVGAGICLKALVRDGSPVEEIVRLAASSGSDMIIVGRHAHRGLRRWFHHSTIARLVSRASCPIVAL